MGLQVSKESRELFEAATKVVLGNGESANFWTDPWLHGRRQRDLAPQVMAVRTQESSSVDSGGEGNFLIRTVN